MNRFVQFYINVAYKISVKYILRLQNQGLKNEKLIQLKCNLSSASCTNMLHIQLLIYFILLHSFPLQVLHNLYVLPKAAFLKRILPHSLHIINDSYLVSCLHADHDWCQGFLTALRSCFDDRITDFFRNFSVLLLAKASQIFTDTNSPILLWMEEKGNCDKEKYYFY